MGIRQDWDEIKRVNFDLHNLKLAVDEITIHAKERDFAAESFGAFTASAEAFKAAETAATRMEQAFADAARYLQDFHDAVKAAMARSQADDQAAEAEFVSRGQGAR